MFMMARLWFEEIPPNREPLECLRGQPLTGGIRVGERWLLSSFALPPLPHILGSLASALLPCCLSCRDAKKTRI